jgi:hypothetical protein
MVLVIELLFSTLPHRTSNIPAPSPLGDHPQAVALNNIFAAFIKKTSTIFTE